MSDIPDWLHQEINDYFIVPFPFQPVTILDIGANIGAFALRAHQEWPAAQIICYEPMPFNIELLQNNVTDTWCQVVPCAVRATAGEEDIFIGDLFVTGGFYKGIRQTSQTLRVNCHAAQDVASCELVKIDTEGSEVEILQHLDLSKTKAVLLEYHSRADEKTLTQLLAAANFRLVHNEPKKDIGTMIFLR